MFTNAQEMLAKYEALQAPDASPMSVASLLISISITLLQKPADLSNELAGIKDTASFVRKVTEAVEETVVSNDTLAGTLEGIETSLLYIRL
jgi:ABC-type antimicrobial peptide transport system permease subunit